LWAVVNVTGTCGEVGLRMRLGYFNIHLECRNKMTPRRRFEPPGNYLSQNSPWTFSLFSHAPAKKKKGSPDNSAQQLLAGRSKTRWRPPRQSSLELARGGELQSLNRFTGAVEGETSIKE
jgi:hypothetical protein